MGGHTIHVSSPLPAYSSNNIAEMRAVHVALLIAVAIRSIHNNTQSIFLADSLLVVNHLQLGWSFPEDTRLATVVRLYYKAHFKPPTDELFWIRGHGGIDGNECADTDAKEGANSSSPPLHTKLAWPLGFDNTNDIVTACNNALKLGGYSPHNLFKFPP